MTERVSAKTEAVRPRAEARDEAVRTFQELACTGIMRLVDEALAADDEPRRWSATKAVEVARSLDASLSTVALADEAWNRAKSDLNGRFLELDTALGRGAFHPSMIEDAGVYVVRARFHGTDVTIAELGRALDGEIATRQRILHERERAILEEHLLGEISTHLHDLIRSAEELVRGMNREIESRPMSSGMRIRFAWRPRADGPAGLDDVRKRLLATQAAWSPEEQAAIGEFLHARIAEVRAQSDRPTWQDDLFEAFDYRKWHRFVIEREQDGRWQPLTRRTHGTGSGGEKAIALTLPQVAAASAYYRSAKPFAPRLILLDEVFVGVDNPMRSKCFGLLNAFDLDFVMTSEREWGCYPTIPGLAIYQLTARKGIEAIHAARFVWNGRERVRDDA